MGRARLPAQITQQAISIDEPPGKPLSLCRRVPALLTVCAESDAKIRAREGPVGLLRQRVHRLVHETLVQEDRVSAIGVSLKTIKRIRALYRQQGERLPWCGEVQDMVRGVSREIPVIHKYAQDLSFSWMSLALGRHGITRLARYLRQFAPGTILEDRGLVVDQVQSIVGISPKSGRAKSSPR